MTLVHKIKSKIKQVRNLILQGQKLVSSRFFTVFAPLRVKIYQSAIASDPKNSQLYYKLGKAFEDSAKFDEAVANYQFSLDIQGELKSAYIAIANILQNTKNLKEVISILKYYKVIDDPELASMLVALEKAPELYHPSKFWIYYAVLNIYQLKYAGIENFKRTVNNNYFNWVLSGISPQVKVLEQEVFNVKDEDTHIHENLTVQIAEKPVEWTDSQYNEYKKFLYLLWEFSKKMDRLQLLTQVQEPLLGNPLAVERNDLLISQDICNSVMEVNSAMEGFGAELPAKLKVAELGAGYGRIAYVLLQTHKNIQVTIIDIPPALYIAQFYLSQLFPKLEIFKFRAFSSYEDIKKEYENSSIAFFSADQVEHLPKGIFDLFINVSSLHEMTVPQINMWFEQIDRLGSGFFYSKQWIESRNPMDEIIVHRDSYPIRENWQEIYNRNCPVQTNFFEALYRLQ